MPKETPIIFNSEMVRAILDGRKTMTRRPMKVQPLNVIYHKGNWIQASCDADIKDRILKNPFGQIGDRLWVRETFRVSTPDDCSCYDDCNCKSGYPIYRATFDQGENEKWRPSIHMPRWASRIPLEITNIRVERVQDITEEEAIKEGVDSSIYPDGSKWGAGFITAIKKFKTLWDSIYSEKYPLDLNPWVWVIEFRRVKCLK